ncbi:hypothetical protein GP486_001180 [Trichoglossum hirsutum]|uniref:Uncharacterized protein n=1 Tax=Trichoglossum hirsutum TaxID=265104 RepID=A0A9P8RTA1_9PEZI|nr:hypothetical protein GP486_001180 [Trichoglossum hirsutum]
MAWLGHSLTRVSRPRTLSGRKSDLDVWRTILKLFLDAKILSKEAEGISGSRDQLTSVQRLMGLRNQIFQARLSNSFRCEESRPLLIELFEVFTNCLQFQSFLTYHYQAIVEALGKFEDNTSLK